MVQELVNQFIQNPIPVWENKLTSVLIEKKWKHLSDSGIEDVVKNYNTAVGFYKRSLTIQSNKYIISDHLKTSVFLEEPQTEFLNEFYHEHGLEPLNGIDLAITKSQIKLQKAFDALRFNSACFTCVSSLIKAIQVLKQNDPDIDTSFSHPNIPFSVFVSVCQDTTTISNLRVAESILHEAMHLKLSLIEELIPLVQTQTFETFYSPWRDEQRPVAGVLHGLFVFRAIKCFYEEMAQQGKLDSATNSFILSRLNEISNEFKLIDEFYESPGLTEEGGLLSIKLLKY